MATTVTIRVNYVDADVNYATTPADYIDVDPINDYFIWSKDLNDLLDHEPTSDELNEHAEAIDDVDDVTVSRLLLMDSSHNIGGSYYTHIIKGMGENKRYVLCFSFDNVTATIPRLEAWDDNTHTTADNLCLGNGTPANSFIKAVKTTDSLPGASWAGTPIAGASNYVELDTAALTGAKDLYANVKIVIPGAYVTPAQETFVLTVRYTYL